MKYSFVVGKMTQILTFLRRAFIFFFILSALTTHVEADPKLEIAEEYRASGYDEQQKGNLNDALNYYFKASALGLQSPTLFNDIAIIYEEIGIDQKAENYYLKAINTDKSYLPAYMNIAYFYQKHGQKDKAAEYFRLRYEFAEAGDPWGEKAKEELLRLRPDYQKWITYLEAQKLSQQIEDDAQEDLIKRVKLSKDHFQRGKQHFSLQEYQKAVQEYDHALKLLPDNPRYREARQKAMVEMSKQNVRNFSEEAMRMLEAGDTAQARTEIRKMLTTIPSR